MTDEEVVCRICRCGGSDDQPLFHPCRCRGSVRFVHEQCCLEWLRHNGQRQRCELCAAQLHFDPVYAVDAPQRLSTVELVVGVVSRVLNVAIAVVHTAIALALWIVTLPATVVGVFRYAVGGLPPDATNGFSFMTVAYGAAIVVASIVVYILLVAFVDLISLFYEEILLRFNEEDFVFDNAQVNAAVADPEEEEEEEEGPEEDDEEEDQEEEQIVAPQPEAPQPEAPQPEAPPQLEAPQPAAPAPAPQPAAAQPQPAVPPVRNDLLAQFAGNDDERVIFRELDAALGLHGMVESLSRFLVALLLSLTVEFLMFALPAALGRRLLSSVLFEAPVEHPLLHELIAGFIVLYIVACGVSMSLLAYDQVVRWRDARHGRVLRFCVISAEAVLTSLKVTLVLVIELAVFPFALGYATEMALLPVTDETWAERAALHAAWPIMSLLSRWVVGIAYMYSFAASITNVRRVLRPGVLWFIRNPDDPRFDPVSEIVSRSVARHTRRLFASFLVYLVVLLSLTALPVALLRLANQMPLQTLTASGDPFMFSSSDLVMFNLLVPPMVRLYRFAPLASRALQAALRTFARALGLETYFFGFAQGEAVPNDPELVMYLNGEAEADEARGPFFERQAPYLRASWFALRALVVVALMWLTVVALVVLVVWAPLATGRLLRQRTLRTLAVSSDIHAFFVGALVLGFAIVFVGNVVHAAGVAWRHYVAMRDGDAPPAANDGAPAVPPAAPVEAAALQRAPRDPAQIRANVWRFWRSMTKMAVVALVAGLVKPVLVGSVFRLTFIDSSPAWSFSLSIVDDWLFGAVIEALRYAHAMVSRGDNVWRLPGEAAAALPAPLLQRFDVYDMSLLLRETAEVAMYSLTLRSVRVVVSFALGTFGMSVLHRRYISHFILLLAPVWNGLGNVIGSTGRYLEELHQSIRDERYRIGVKLRNNNE